MHWGLPNGGNQCYQNAALQARPFISLSFVDESKHKQKQITFLLAPLANPRVVRGPLGDRRDGWHPERRVRALSSGALFFPSSCPGFNDSLSMSDNQKSTNGNSPLNLASRRKQLTPTSNRMPESLPWGFLRTSLCRKLSLLLLLLLLLTNSVVYSATSSTGPLGLSWVKL